MTLPSSSKLLGTKAPASLRAWFLATAVSEAWLAQAPAWPNWTWRQKDDRLSSKITEFSANNKTWNKFFSTQPTDLWSKHGGAGSNTPAHHRLCYPALSDALANLVLFCASNLGVKLKDVKLRNGKKILRNSHGTWPISCSHLSKHHYHLDPWSVLVAQDMIHEGRTWIPR